MALTTEIAPDVHRISIHWPEINLQFNHFLVVDDEPLLYHTGMRRMFPGVLEAVKRVVDPASLRWIGFSHFEVDECGSLNDWLEIAPRALDSVLAAPRAPPNRRPGSTGVGSTTPR